MALLETKKFLEYFPNHILTAWRFKDNKVWEKTNIILNVSEKKAEQLNWLKDKRDIFFTPNGEYKKIFKDQEKTIGKTKKSVVDMNNNIYSFTCDTDCWEKSWEWLWLTPTIIIKTKHWYHMHFIFKNPVAIADYLKRWETIQNMFIPLLKADWHAKDIARLFRVPWFTYRADNLWETQIEVEQYNPDEIYTFDEREKRIMATYEVVCADQVEKQQLKKQFKKSNTIGKVLDAVFDKVKDIPAVAVLEQLYSQYQWNEAWAISEWWKTTWWYKYRKEHNYVKDFSHDRPRWWPRKLAKQYFQNLDMTLSYFQDNWNIKIDKLRTEIGSESEIVFSDISLPWTKEKSAIRHWNNIEWIIIDSIKKEIRWYNSDSTDIPFLDCLIKPIWFIRWNDWESVETIVEIERKDGSKNITILPVCSNLKEFRKFMMKYRIIIPEKAKFYVSVYDYMYKTQVKQYYFTNKLWLQLINNKKVLVKKTGSYIMEEEDVYVSIVDWEEVEIVLDDNKKTIKEYMAQVVKWYWWRIVVPVVLGMILWVNAYYFRKSEKKKIQLPQMFVFWISQSWKTTMLDHIFRSFWIDRSLSATSSAFVFEKNAKHYIPTHFSEFRASAVKNIDAIEWLFRNLFDWTVQNKWQANQTLVRYEANGYYVLDGQTIFGDDAALTRMFVLLTGKECMLEEKYLQTLPNIYHQATEIFKTEEDFEKFLGIAQEEHARIKKWLVLERDNNRMLENYSFLYALCRILWLEDYIHYIDTAVRKQDVLTANDDIHKVYSTILNLQVTYKFDADILWKWILINASEESIRFSPNMVDLKWFIKTVNAEYLEDNMLSWLETYIDLNYIYKHKQIRWVFFRALNFITFTKTNYTEEERATIRSLRAFVQANNPDHAMIYDIVDDLFTEKKPWKSTSQEAIEVE